jgi:hypothetical protein
MMNNLDIVIPLAIAVSGVLFYLLVPRQKPRGAAVPSFPGNPGNGSQSLPSAKHYAYFPQIRQALSAADSDYLMKNAAPAVARQALRERRLIARRFLEGLHEDFSNLSRLGRIVAALSPEISRQQETERLLLSLKFQLLYALVWLRLSTGNLPLPQLESLTGLVGRLATRMDEAMTEISALSAGRIPSQLRA